jgi:hypothetical protein
MSEVPEILKHILGILVYLSGIVTFWFLTWIFFRK